MKQLAEQSKRPSKLPSLPPSLHRSILESIKSAANSSQHLQTRDTESIETIWRKKGRGRRIERHEIVRKQLARVNTVNGGNRGKNRARRLYIYIYIKEKYRKERKNSERLLIKAFPLVSTSPVVSLPRRLYPIQTETRYYLDSPESNRRDTSRSYV